MPIVKRKYPLHIKNYFDYFGLDETDVIECECGCGEIGTDFHHLRPRSMFEPKDPKKDKVENVACVTRDCHNRAARDREFNYELAINHRKKMLKHSNNDSDLIRYS